MNTCMIQQAIKAFALQLGFNDAGFCAAEPVEQYVINAYYQWLDRRDHGQMNYMAQRIEERFKPSLLAGFEVNTIIAVVMNYFHSENEKLLSQKSRYKISRYALGRDYHKVFRKRMNRLAEYIRGMTGKNAKPYVDTSPVLEKYWAAKTGMGVIGQNTCFIHHKYGSWVFLGIIYCEAKIYTSFQKGILLKSNTCNGCASCLRSCPTGALVAPFVLQSQRCISYLTIEHKTSFDEKTPHWKNWIWGCDVCQQVCPHNKKPVDTPMKDFLIHPSVSSLLTLEDLSQLNHIQLHGTSLQRGGKERLPRNIKWVNNS